MGYKICPYCGAALDPEEKCDCREETEDPCAAVPQQKKPADISAADSKNNNL